MRQIEELLISEWQVEHDIDEHPDQKLQFRIGNLQAHTGPARGLIHFRPNETQASREGLVRIGVHGDRRRISHLHPVNIALKNLGRILGQNHSMIRGYARVSTGGQSVKARMRRHSGEPIQDIARTINASHTTISRLAVYG